MVEQKKSFSCLGWTQSSCLLVVLFLVLLLHCSESEALKLQVNKVVGRTATSQPMSRISGQQINRTNGQTGRNSGHLIVEQAPTPTTNAKRTTTMNEPAKQLQLYPGLLDETLLNQGSFSFDAKTVKFDKLKVLGNVYVRRINGKLLRDAYLLKSTVEKRDHQANVSASRVVEGDNREIIGKKMNEEIRLKIIS